MANVSFSKQVNIYDVLPSPVFLHRLLRKLKLTCLCLSSWAQISLSCPKPDKKESSIDMETYVLHINSSVISKQNLHAYDCFYQLNIIYPILYFRLFWRWGLSSPMNLGAILLVMLLSCMEKMVYKCSTS